MNSATGAFSPAAHPEVTLHRHLEGSDGEAAVSGVEMDARLARELFLRREEGRVAHVQRLEDVCGAVDFEPLARDSFDQPASPVDADPIGPSLAGVEDERDRRRFRLAEVQTLAAQIAGDLHAREVVGEPGRVGQQAPQRDLRPCGPRDRRAGRVEPGQDLWLGEGREEVPDGFVERNQPALHQLQGGYAGDGLGARRDVEDRVRCGSRTVCVSKLLRRLSVRSLPMSRTEGKLTSSAPARKP